MLLSMLAMPVLASCGRLRQNDRAEAVKALEALERSSGGRLGVAALDTGNGASISYRATERFAMCSTFKFLLVAAVLERSAREPALLSRLVHYTPDVMTSYSPVTGKHIASGMTVEALCDSAMRYSDNTAANLLLDIIGGPHALMDYIHSLGDWITHLDRYEPDLNTAIAGDDRDTTTPAAMLGNMQRLLLGNALPIAQRKLLLEWMTGNTTGNARIRAGVPAQWLVGDKTGTGDNGSANDIAILWPPGKAPILLMVYYTGSHNPPEQCSTVIAAAARIVTRSL